MFDNQSRLFTEIFSSKGRKGTGSELYIGNKIIQQHGGSMEVSSVPQRGSRFTLIIPRAHQSEKGVLSGLKGAN